MLEKYLNVMVAIVNKDLRGHYKTPFIMYVQLLKRILLLPNHLCVGLHVRMQVTWLWACPCVYSL